MSGLISIYLDVFRFLAALGVFFFHAEHLPVSSHVLPYVYFNHKLVIVFFVISGYVIAASAARPDRTFANYSADRLGRLSSVVIPALFLTYVLDAIGVRLLPDIYSNINPQWQSIRFTANFFYCQQIWFLCLNPSSNNPFWSLGYEFWYYVLFGILVFARIQWAKILLLVAVSLFVGPKILLLLPAWAVGALAFHAGRRFKCSGRSALLLFIITGVAVIASLLFENQLGMNNGKVGLPPLYYSYNYVGDNLFAVILAANFFACALFSRQFKNDFEPRRVVRFIRWMASHTFSLYLYHVPLLFFIRAVTKYDPHNPYEVAAALCVALVIVSGLSKITEEQYPLLRTRARRWMTTLLERIRLRGAKPELLSHPQKS
jgi:peptidoglycan/LPS O-acetylase OafA/YrhL